MHKHQTSRRSFLAAAVAIALPIDGDNEIEPNWDDEFVWEPTAKATPSAMENLPQQNGASEVETVDALAIFYDTKWPDRIEEQENAWSFAATVADAEAHSAHCSTKHIRPRAEPVSIRFPGGKRFMVVELTIWDRDCEFEPQGVFDLPPFLPTFNPFTDQWAKEFRTREDAIRLASEKNGPLLSEWDQDSDEWWAIIEVGECDLPYLIGIELTGEVGHMDSSGRTPVRIVRPTAAEVESIERDALLYDLAGEEGGVA